MSVITSFPPEHIKDVIRNTFSLSETSEVTFSMDKCLTNEQFILLTVKPVEKKYVLVKVPRETQTEQNTKDSKVIYPVFVIKNNNKEYYGAYENQNGLEHFVSPDQNNIESLKIILENLAEYQAAILAEARELEKPDKYNLKDITDAVTSLDFFKDFDSKTIKESTENLQVSFNKYLESDLLVRSIGCPLAKNVYLNQGKNQTVFLNIPSTKLVPPLYDALLYIFSLSNEEFRKNHFEHVLNFYLESLKSGLQKLQSTVVDKFTRGYCERQVNVLVPVVKFTIARKLEDPQKLQELLRNIGNFIKYPLVNQEDVYETTNTYFGSTKYDLLDYTFVCLSDKYGHLGEYFHLDIKVKFDGAEHNLQLFAKFVLTTGFLAQFIETGPAKNEDFIYKTLIPLFAENGLHDLLDFAPKCYLSKTWLLVLDDLSRQGYVALKPNAVLNYEGLRASLKSLAKFHASCIILEEILSQKLGKTFRLDEKYGEFLQASSWTYNEHTRETYYQTLNTIYYLLEEKFPEVTEHLALDQDEIRARVKAEFKSSFDKTKRTDKIRNVINHGDMYVCNVLVKFGKDKLVEKGILIDFQLLRYISPSYDVTFFLYENSNKETRDKYFNKLIEDYYGFMSDNLRRFNLNPEEIFPSETFYKDIKYMKSAGWMGAIGYALVMHIDPVSREKMLEEPGKFLDYMGRNKRGLVDDHWHCESYRNILKGFVEDLVDIIKT